MKKFTVVILLFVMVISIFVVNTNKESKIEKILKNEYYSYLPKEAKEYIKDVYEKSDLVILTEKNKEENVPYLNPDYVDYLVLSDEEKQDVDVIPNSLITDYVYQNKNYETGDIPSTFDLRNVNNKNFITPLKNQGSLGICWIFSSIEQAESNLMVTTDTSYNNDIPKFSVRQLDYATSTDGINNYVNENGYRPLTSGGNFFMSSLIMSNGLALVNDSFMPYNYNVEPKELFDVLNYGNAMYEVDSTIMMPNLDSHASIQEKEEFMDSVKTYIMEYGGAFVGTGSPSGSCGAKNTDNKYIIADDDSCNESDNYDGHAMQIIGWDDNYNYSYCEYNNRHLSVNSSNTCDNGTLKNGTGAWLVRNSWGNDTDYKYVYLAYSASSYEINFTTSLSSMDTRTWDNNYHDTISLDSSVTMSTLNTEEFTKSISGNEKIEKIKFMNYSQNAQYIVSVNSDSHQYNNITSFNVEMPGIYTIDLSSFDVIIEDDDFSVTIVSTNNAYSVLDTISVFTSNIDDTPVISTEDIVIDAPVSGDIDLVVYSKTKNIPSNATVNYSLFKNDIDLSDYLTVTYNGVAENNINAYVNININKPSGVYTLKMEYDDNVFESLITVNGTSTEGTVDNPYMIYNEEDLSNIRNDLTAYYKLANDIVLQNNWTSIGTENYPFLGSLDGDGHTISNLVSNNGLFGYVSGNTDDEFISIKDLTIKDASISGTGNVGILIGNLNVSDDEYVNINDVYIIGGEVTSTNGNAGIIGNLTSTLSGNDVNINNIFSSATISGFNSSGIIGNVSDNVSLNINNLENIGIIIALDDTNNNYSGIIGNLGDVTSLSLNNFIITSLNKYDGNINGQILNKSLNEIDSFTYDNGYYIKTDNDLIDFYADDGNHKIMGINDSSILTDDVSFNNNWDINTIDGIKRIPIIKGVDFEYTNTSTINLTVGDTVSLLDYITPTTDALKIHYTISSNEEKISVSTEYEDNTLYPSDIIIEGLQAGTTTIHVISDYDGYENDITVNVLRENTYITFYSNDGNDNSKVQTVTNNINVALDDNTFTRVGYIFKEWNTQANGEGQTYLNKAVIEEINDNLELYAIWQPIKYYIKYNANGGSGSMQNQEVTYDVSTALTKNIFVRDGYTFVGWNTQANGGGTSYTDEQVIRNLSNINRRVVNLYAIWQSDTTYVINKYSYDTNKKYISKIIPGTTVNSFKSNIVLGSGYTISVDSINNILNTGGKTKIYKNGSLVIEFNNIVIGDINGDSVVNSADLLRMRQHLIGIKVLDGIYFISSDINYDNIVNSADLLRIRQHLLGSKLIN